jgi:alpha-L-fucosidase
MFIVHKRYIQILSTVVLFLTSCLNSTDNNGHKNTDYLSNSDWWKASMENHEERISWWNEARFGMFVHWGVYSVPAGVYKGNSIGRNYAEHLMRIQKIPLKEYKNELVEPFNPINFNAEEWIKVAKNAGMKYFVITAKHHDGFAMYDSDISAYNITDASEFGRDPMVELKKACEKYGIKFGFYYSHAFDWEHPDAPGNDWDYENPGGDKHLFGRDYYNHHPDLVKRMAKYVDQKSIPQIRELITKYEPDIMWFDTPHKLSFSENLRILHEIRKTSAEVVVNGRLAKGYGDYENTADRPYAFYPTDNQYWEAIPTTNESYAYNRVDDSHKPAPHFIRLLANASSRGGNLLMNIGPKGNGAIDEKDLNILKQIGTWINLNGESIYGTAKSPLPLQSWGVITQKDNFLYLHILNWPADNRLILAGLRSNYGNAFLLADSMKQSLPINRINTEDIEINLPSSPPDSVNTVIKLEVKEKVKSGRIRLLSILSKNDLLAFDSRLHGNSLRYGDGKQNRYYVYNWNNKDQYLSWDTRLNESSGFDVSLKYLVMQSCEGRLNFSANEQVISMPVRKVDKESEIRNVVLGRIHLDSGTHSLKLSAEEISGKELMRVFEISLIPIHE